MRKKTILRLITVLDDNQHKFTPETHRFLRQRLNGKKQYIYQARKMISYYHNKSIMALLDKDYRVQLANSLGRTDLRAEDILILGMNRLPLLNRYHVHYHGNYNLQNRRAVLTRQWLICSSQDELLIKHELERYRLACDGYVKLVQVPW